MSVSSMASLRSGHFALVLVFVFALSLQTLTDGQGHFCEWIGHSPFCFGECPKLTYPITTAKSDPVRIPGFSRVLPYFGRSCVTGSKKLCCGGNGLFFPDK
ncbi:unnamed protein product [Notodromas monacha]|uniref:Uncharacterized protein n=1 Tax=Notodromas monacha TaxID=399045 RepID=A0A7R9BR25_9CRUS|nr:unnamed protein product [Notodromas monacha]CAG0919037.1 unnamed protein product [Notodromas monacha]